ncbi:MAG: Mpo1-like protein [Bacteroidia bacterium]|jgi:uncharacterized membrane protein YGL010W
MKTMQNWFDEYAESHQNPVNKAIHWVCIPLIFFSLVCLLLEVRPVADFSLASMVMIAVLIYYFMLSRTIALGMLMVYLLCLTGAKIWIISFDIPLWQMALTVFVLAWIGQFIGHKIEGKKPSFLKDLQFLLIGPAWLLHFLFRKVGIPV